MSLLKLDNLKASYGAAQALFGVSLTVEPGEVLALMGRNGMGKTTTIRAICRMIPSTGTAELDDQNLHALPSHKVARLGVGLVPEGRRCFGDLSVRENLVAASRPGFWTYRTVTDLFQRMGEREGQKAASLSGGEQQMLAIGRALMTNPRLLILDEATEGLAPIIRQEIWAAIGRLKTETGMALIVVDKSLKELSNVSDRGVILERGASVWEGAIADLTPDMTNQYLGV
ncbi:MAG: ABC transporter ATP-binding protein [Pseudomonadota bacterium]